MIPMRVDVQSWAAFAAVCEGDKKLTLIQTQALLACHLVSQELLHSSLSALCKHEVLSLKC